MSDPIHWPTFWAADKPVGPEWVLEPLVAAGRQTAVFSRPKLGKSLVALDAAARAATGCSVFGLEPRPPLNVVYIDLEMSEDDLRERLSDLGYGPENDLSRLAYYLLPDLPPLDTAAGGQALLDIVSARQAELVVLDTMTSGTEGPEDKADTFRAFYTHTGRRLKEARVALLRLDHAGKDPEAGQRGSSAKDGDVDVVFALAVKGGRVHLTRTHSRVQWIPREVVLERLDDPLRHVLVTGKGEADDKTAAKVNEVVGILDELGVPDDASVRQADQAMRDVGAGRRVEHVSAAVKLRKARG